MWFRGAHASMVVYDVSQENWVEDLIEWFEKIQEHAQFKPIVMLVGNKLDLLNGPDQKLSPGETEWPIPPELQSYSLIRFHRHISAKTGEGFDQAFQDLSRELWLHAPREATDPPPVPLSDSTCCAT